MGALAGVWSDQLVDGLADGVEHGLVRGLLLGRLGVDHRLGCRLLPGPEIGEELLRGERHAVDVARHAAVGGALLLTARPGRLVAAHLALGLSHGGLLLAAEVSAVVVPAVRGDGLDLVVALVVPVEDLAAHSVLLDPALASVAHGEDEGLGIELVAGGEGHTRRTGLAVNGSRLVLGGGLLLAGALRLGEVAADDRLDDFGRVVDLGLRVGVNVGNRDERDQVGEIHGGGSCVWGWMRWGRLWPWTGREWERRSLLSWVRRVWPLLCRVQWPCQASRVGAANVNFEWHSLCTLQRPCHLPQQKSGEV